MKRSTWLSALLLVFTGCASSAHSPLPRNKHVELVPTGERSREISGLDIPLAELPKVEDRVDVPGFEGASGWLNVDHPLEKAELKGRVVVVDFWTSCCINCLHTLPVLKQIEARFQGQPVVVVGVHSPKFENERGIDRLRDILRDNGIEHPVAVDANMAIWDAWGAQGWPTVAVLDAEGRAVWAGSGEPDADALTIIIASALAEARSKGKLATGELKGLRREPDRKGALRYPGKVLALDKGRLAVADTGHSRVILLDGRGGVEHVIGSGIAGKVDGSFDEARFSRPQGMVELDGDLYVADAGNHTIRKIDRKTRTVTTVAGTGELGYRKLSEDEQPAKSFALRSPWDLLRVGDTIYVALAGSHQIAAFDPKRGTLRLFAGNGHEARADGSLSDASFAQPSALATDGKEIFVLDSETSSVRAIDPQKGEVRTIVGRDLFVFGDVDGDSATARLQHPIGMTFAAGAIWVADSYNSKIKRVDPRTGETHTLLGGADRRDLDEPAGLSAGADALFVADTNHHRVLSLPIGKTGPIAEVALGSLKPPSAPARMAIRPSDLVLSLGTLKIAPGAASQVRVKWQIPSGTGVNEEAPLRVTWVEAPGLARVPDATRLEGAAAREGFTIMLEPARGISSASLLGVLEMVLCDEETHAACLPVRRTLKASVVVEPGASAPEVSIALPSAR